MNWELEGYLTLGNYGITSEKQRGETWPAKYMLYELEVSDGPGEYVVGYFNTIENALGVVEEMQFDKAVRDMEAKIKHEAAVDEAMRELEGL